MTEGGFLKALNAIGALVWDEDTPKREREVHCRCLIMAIKMHAVAAGLVLKEGDDDGEEGKSKDKAEERKAWEKAEAEELESWENGEKKT